MLIIFTLTGFQLLYDLEFFFVPCYDDVFCNNSTSFLKVFGGLSVTFWTNVISLVLLRIVKSLRSLDIYEYYFGTFVAIFIVSFTLATVTVVYYSNEGINYSLQWTYLALRYASIIFNIVIYAMVWGKLGKMGFWGKENAQKRKFEPLVALTSRLKYYPVLQILSIIGETAYGVTFGFKTDSYGASHMSPMQSTFLCLYAVSSTSAGLGYFIVFLTVQPKAYNHFKEKILKPCSAVLCCCCNYATTSSNQSTGNTDTTRSCSVESEKDTNQVLASQTSGASSVLTPTRTEFTRSDDNGQLPVYTPDGSMSYGGVAGYDIDDCDEDYLAKEIDSRFASLSAALLEGRAGGGDMKNVLHVTRESSL